MSQTYVKQNHREQGFTLLEVLVAISLFGILLAVLIPSITGLLSINRQGEAQLSSTTRAQQVIESVKGAWQLSAGLDDAAETQVIDRYNRNCVSGLILPAGVTLQSQSLDSRAASPGTLADVSRAATCPAAPSTIPPMRRVKVTAGSGSRATTLTLDVLGPQ